MKNYFSIFLLLAVSPVLYAQDDINLLDLVRDVPAADSVSPVQTLPTAETKSELSASSVAPNVYDWREHRHSVSVSVGSPSLFSGTTGILTALFKAFDQTADIHVSVHGSYGLHYHYNVLKWLRVGGSFVYNSWKDVETGSGNYYHRESYHEFAFVGTVDFTYLNREHVRLYSGMGLGGTLNMTDYYGHVADFKPVSEKTYFPTVAWYITALGIEAGGKRVYGLAEINIGTADLLRAGIGVRF